MGYMKDIDIYVQNGDYKGLEREYGTKTALWAFGGERPKKRKRRTGPLAGLFAGIRRK